LAYTVTKSSRHSMEAEKNSPSIPLSFNLAIVLPRRSVYALASYNKNISFLYNTHRSGCRLQGYQILFDPYTLASDRQFI